MRKTEEKIIRCITDGMSGTVFSKQLTERDRVESTALGVRYFLWGTCLFDYDKEKRALTIGPCGWYTQTTASRVKALLSIIYPGAVVRKKGGMLHIYRFDGGHEQLTFSEHTFCIRQ